MRTNVVIWWVLTVFFVVVAIWYTLWNIGVHQGPLQNRIEWVGSLGLLCVAIMSALIGFYVGRVQKAQGGELPEDNPKADIDDGDPEMGEFSPWSWWPLVLAFSAAIIIIGLAVGWWLIPIGLGVFLVAIVGWVYEYYRGYFAH